MSHDDSGLKSVLKLPKIYLWAQQLAGSDQVYRTFVDEYLQPQAGMRILDIGCGPATLLDWLPGDIYYRGVDFNPDYIDAAKRRFGAKGKFDVGRAENLEQIADLPFDRIIGFGLLHHLSDVQAAKFISAAGKLISTAGRFVTIDPAYTTDQSGLSRALIRRDRGQAVRQPDGYHDLVAKTFGHSEIDVRHNLGRIPWTHCIVNAGHSNTAQTDNE